jgi:NAD kinase
VTIQRIGFAYNPTIDAAVDLSARASGWCRMNGIEDWEAQADDYDALRRELPSTDALVVLGGDGTFLRAARIVAEIGHCRCAPRFRLGSKLR